MLFGTKAVSLKLKVYKCSIKITCCCSVFFYLNTSVHAFSELSVLLETYIYDLDISWHWCTIIYKIDWLSVYQNITVWNVSYIVICLWFIIVANLCFLCNFPNETEKYNNDQFLKSSVLINNSLQKWATSLIKLRNRNS